MRAGVLAPLLVVSLVGALPARAGDSVDGAGGSETATAAAAPTKSAAQVRRERENAEVIRLAEKETGALDLPGDERAGGEGRSLWGAVIQMIIVLGGVSLLAYLLLGKVLPRILRVPVPGGRPRLMRVVDRLPIDQRRSLLLVAIGEEYFLVGASEGGIELISRLDADTVRRAEAGASPEHGGGLGRFTEALAGRSSKEP